MRRATAVSALLEVIPLFLSTLSLRRATVVNALKLADLMLFLSTLSLRRATASMRIDTGNSIDFYPRSPCGERQPATKRHDKDNIFLSTLSLRRATLTSVVSSTGTTDFYPRSPCGERRAPRITPTASRNFYPRSPCGERLYYFTLPVSRCLFLSTLSLRRATTSLRFFWC